MMPDPSPFSPASSLRSPRSAPDRAANIGKMARTVVSRHDHHNIEIKTVFEASDGPWQCDLDCFLFIPGSFEIRAWGKNELHRDVRSRIRLSVPTGGERGYAAVAGVISALRAAIARLESEPADEWWTDSEDPLLAETVDTAKDLCAVVAETLKRAAAEQSRSLWLARSLASAPDRGPRTAADVELEARKIAAVIESVRELLEAPRPAGLVVFDLADEYVSQLYTQYLGSLRTEIDGVGGAEKQWRGLEATLDSLQEREARYRRRRGWLREGEDSEAARERRLVRMSHLKKFFQARNFIDVHRETAAKRISEPVALLGTAFAGIVAALFQQLSRPDLVNVASQGLFVISFGVIAYVLRDRLKDWTVASFREKARRFVPDFEQQLWAKDRRVGTVKEWFRTLPKGRLSDAIMAIRRQAAQYEMEAMLPEDVFHYRKSQLIEGVPGLAGRTGPSTKALHENIRINVERYLKHMDDPFKELIELDPAGRIRTNLSHRVYHFYLVVRTAHSRVAETRFPRWWPQAGETRAAFTQTLLYRLVLDKNGLVRLEDCRLPRDRGVHNERGSGESDGAGRSGQREPVLLT